MTNKPALYLQSYYTFKAKFIIFKEHIVTHSFENRINNNKKGYYLVYNVPHRFYILI